MPICPYISLRRPTLGGSAREGPVRADACEKDQEILIHLSRAAADAPEKDLLARLLLLFARE